MINEADNIYLMIKPILLFLSLLNIVLNACDKNCLNCTSSSECSRCYDGYYLLNGYCKPCPLNCIKCSNSSSCDSCYSNYVYSAEYGSCVSSKCDKSKCSFCLINVHNSMCTNCNNGNYLSKG